MTTTQRHSRPRLGLRPARCPWGVRVLLAASLVAAGVARPAAAHEYWLAPSRYIAAAHQAVDVSALAGTGFRGERKPFAAPHCVRLTVRGQRQLDLLPVARDGEYVWARFAPSDDGGALIAFQSDWTPITLPAPRFDEYLKLEGLDQPLAARTHTPARA